MTRRILVLGAAGMAGHVIATYLSEQGYEVDTVSGSKKFDKKTRLINVLQITSLESYLKEHNYDVVVNCIGMLVRQSESDKDKAVFLNSYLPHFLEKHFEKSKTKLIHLSTDCVFSGKNAPYKEASWYDGELFYDRTKALGEINNDKDLTFRMSIIGPDMQLDGIGLFNWFFQQSGDISGYSKAMWTGVTTIELAKGINEAILQDLTGLYHFVPESNISKFELLRLFRDIFVRDDINVLKNDQISLDKTLVNTRSDFNYTIPDYVDMVNDMKTWVSNHSKLYNHYQRNVDKK